MSATQQGVENHRRAALADIVKNRGESLVAELKDGGASEEDLASVTPAPDENTDDPNRPADISPETWNAMSDEEKSNALAAADEGTTVTETATVEEPKAKIKIKVDGKEQEVDQDAVLQAGIKALQKETAADKRLEEAARLKKEAEAAAAQAAQARQQNTETTLSRQDATLEQLTDQDYVETVKKVQYGTPEEASAALKSLVAKAATSGQSETLTMAHVSEMLDFREANQWAHDEYKDILGEPKLKALFVQEEKRLRAAGDNRPYRELYEEIGTGLRSWRDGLKPTPQTTNSAETRQERKSRIVTVKQAQARPPAPTPTKEPTPSDIIDKMRQARGQA